MSTTTRTPLILRLLVQQGRISEQRQAEAERAVADAAEPELGLIEGEFARPREIAEAHAEHLGIPWLSIDGAGEEQTLIENHADREPHERGLVVSIAFNCWDVSDLISESLCRRKNLVPIAVNDGVLDLACLNPSDFTAVEEVRMRTSCLVRLFAASPEVLEAVNASVFGAPDDVREITSEGALSLDIDDEDGAKVLDLQAPIPVTPESQVQRIVNTVLANAIDLGASDIHFEPYEEDVRVRFRVDGRLSSFSGPTAGLYVPTVSRLKILASMDIAERRVPQDGAIALVHKEQRVDLRVSTVPTIYGEKIVIRILEKSGIPDNLTTLGFSETQARHFLDAARAPHGLMFVTGPTGSGKSTTLYTCLNLINEESENIVTVEDPVEYRFHGLNQVQVQSKVGLTFASALRAFLRQDPDKIMVGEVRDMETAEICMRAALTGHLVLSTLHTNTALQVISRLTDMGVEPFLLGPALRLVEAQRLVRRLCPSCKQPAELPDETAERHGLPAGITVMRPGEKSECSACNGSGTKGRVGLYEVVPITDELRDAVIARASNKDLEAVARRSGIDLIAEDARRKVREGHVDLGEVSQYIQVED